MPTKSSTNRRLLQTAVDHFGMKGVEGVRTRDIAREADTVMSSITYHYGGKDGLHLAAAHYVADRLVEFLGPVLDRAARTEARGREAARDEICDIAGVILNFFLSPESASLSRFIVREQMAPGEAFRILQERVFGRMGQHLRTLVAEAGHPGWDDDRINVTTVTIVGQLLVFRVAHASVMSLTGWDAVTPQRAATIRRVTQTNIRALLAAEDPS
ncbi:hypothetical protein DLJ53_29845 [Acuticoccus sediminis]|uniref:HTH tetR-type domain-containing protein n=1 Tax=Acuticoccus sediminis TaxID=2184697 RepID=A0A8B2NQX2_9HYPH|nr:CerR family C-terminal domain-containing protein [Acuticoccus sediminis]RAH97399.1 hypothetical protein DLJ53_29845 [Acuticoccus sediminis]